MLENTKGRLPVEVGGFRQASQSDTKAILQNEHSPPELTLSHGDPGKARELVKLVLQYVEAPSRTTAVYGRVPRVPQWTATQAKRRGCHKTLHMTLRNLRERCDCHEIVADPARVLRLCT